MSRRISFRPLIFLVLCLLVVMYLARTMSRQGDITYSAMRENVRAGEGAVLHRQRQRA